MPNRLRQIGHFNFGIRVQCNREGWGIESGLNQRLDISYNDDRCRVEGDQGIWILGMFRRLANSLFMEWRFASLVPST